MIPAMAGGRVYKPWTEFPIPTRSQPSEFEAVAKELGLTEQQYAESRELRLWCHENCNRCYIPEWLLKKWGIVVSSSKL